jgi:hypothetical protein
MTVPQGTPAPRPSRGRIGSHLTEDVQAGQPETGSNYALQGEIMSLTDYVIDILLIMVIFRQVRPRQLTLRTVILPLVLVAIAGAVYLRPITLRGDDLVLIVLLAIAGIALGLVSGLADKVWRDQQGGLTYRVGVLSVVAWILGMGFRFGFAYYAYHSGAGAVARFSASHQVTGAGIWTTALVLMAFGQVLARVAVLQARRGYAERQLLSSGPLAVRPYAHPRAR